MTGNFVGLCLQVLVLLRSKPGVKLQDMHLAQLRTQYDFIC